MAINLSIFSFFVVRMRWDLCLGDVDDNFSMGFADKMFIDALLEFHTGNVCKICMRYRNIKYNGDQKGSSEFHVT